MGLIKAALGAAGGTFADQWKEFFYCDSLDKDTLVAKGEKRIGKRSSNKKGEDNVISNGSLITVNDGQCMIIVEQGKVAEICAEPGEYTFKTDLEPSIFTGGLGEGIKNTFKEIGKRFTFGGSPAKDQRVYYINIKEIYGNKYGTPSPVPFRVVDKNIGLDIDISIKCFGEYSYKITNPILFYTNVCGNIESTYDRSEIDSQLKSELMTSLQPAFAKISASGIRYSALPAHTTEIADALNEVLSEDWAEKRGIEVFSFGVSSVTAPEEDEAMIKELQRNAVFRNPSMAAAHLTGAQAAAMQDAAKNEGGGGAFMAFAGMNMANNAGGMNPNKLYEMGEKNNTNTTENNSYNAGASWTCNCGTENTGNFCANCGNKKPVINNWTCGCGTQNTGNFCSNCGNKKPDAEWTCQCGQVNKGNFCSNCGNKR